MLDPAKNRPGILIATRNQGKLLEFGKFLSLVGIDLIDLDSFGPLDDVAETGSTFGENARIKAQGYAVQTGLISLADDSGLEVAALDDRPGVLSARYGGEDTSFDRKIEMLLEELDETGNNDRRARFVCSLAVADPVGNTVFEADGICEGKIASEPRGTGGFGYDPIFVPDGFDNTFGELPSQIKQKISHRARAFGQIIPFLRGFSSISA